VRLRAAAAALNFPLILGNPCGDLSARRSGGRAVPLRRLLHKLLALQNLRPGRVTLVVIRGAVLLVLHPHEHPPKANRVSPEADRGWWRFLFGGIFALPSFRLPANLQADRLARSLWLGFAAAPHRRGTAQ